MQCKSCFFFVFSPALWASFCIALFCFITHLHLSRMEWSLKTPDCMKWDIFMTPSSFVFTRMQSSSGLILLLILHCFFLSLRKSYDLWLCRHNIQNEMKWRQNHNTITAQSKGAELIEWVCNTTTVHKRNKIISLEETAHISQNTIRINMWKSNLLSLLFPVCRLPAFNTYITVIQSAKTESWCSNFICIKWNELIWAYYVVHNPVCNVMHTNSCINIVVHRVQPLYNKLSIDLILEVHPLFFLSLSLLKLYIIK